MDIITELKTGRHRNSKNEMVREIIHWLNKYDSLKRDDFAIDDIFLRELVDKNYLKIDFDEDGNTTLSLDKPTQTFSGANAKFSNSTNKHMDREYSNRYGTILFDSNMLYFYGEFGDKIFRTSLLTAYEINNQIVKFNTLNSSYEFEILKELPTVQLADEDEIKKVMELRDIYVDVMV